MKQNKNNIPEGWQKVTLRQCVDIDRNSLSEKTVDNKEFFYIDLSAVSAGVITFPKEKVSFRNAPSRARRIIHKGDIIFSTVRPYLKGFALIDFASDDYIVSTGFSVLTAKNNFSSKYIYHYLFSENFQKQIFISLLGSSFPALNSKDVKSLSILIPISITEQQKIVEVLETWDKAIQLTRKLIEQKELQKKYLMQQLLSGLLRLAKFTDSWKKEKIGNLGSTYNGIVGKTEKDFGHGTAKYIIFLNILENTAIDIELCEKVDIREEEKQNAVKCGDLFFNSSSETPEEVGMCSALLQTMDNTYLNSFCFGFRPHDIKCLSSLYLAYWFRTNQGRALMVRLAQGSTRYNLSKESFKKSQLLLPSYEEQQEIANILTLADKEIDLLRQKLAKLEEQKKGLMQVLLTGKVRLQVEK